MLTLGFGNAFLAAAGLAAGLRAAACLPDEGFVFAADGLAGLLAAFFAGFFDCLMGVALFTCFGFALAARATVFAPRFAARGFDFAFAMDFFAMSVASTLWCGGRVL
ncbi:MAG TPA: hypothetical protein VJ727_03150 [Rhodanobacteraceae bacterium]|nr:hypothetical protein [Rhodanobacteraceae bacterium]